MVQPANADGLLTNTNQGTKHAGKMTALFNPSAFMVFKTGNLAFSLGVGTITGGGTLRYDSGLPFFEIPLSRQAPDLTILSQLPFPSTVFNVTAYDADINYETSSTYTGIQAGVTYRYNEVLSLFAGVRCTPATNNFRGVIQELQDWNVRYPSVYSGPEFVSGEYSETMGRKRLVCSIGLAYRIFK